jgi:dephospho-CoA kinase
MSIHKPIVLGIIGGIASGKSQVTRILSEMGAATVCADSIAHRVLCEQPIIDALVSSFSRSILNESGTIDRKALSSLVFGSTEEKTANRRKLESIVHPRIREIGKAELASLKANGQSRIIVLDVPLLIEGGWVPLCDRVLFVDSSDLSRQQRAALRGWSAEQLRERESAQLTLSEKKKYATDVLHNDGSLEDLKRQIEELHLK